MKCTNFFFYLSSLLIVLNNQAADFFQLEHLPHGTKIPILKLVNLIPMVKDTPIKDAELQDVYIQAVAETPAVNAHIELLGKIRLKTNLPGLKNFGDLDLSVIGKLFSAFGRGAAPVSSTPLAKPTMSEKPAKTIQQLEEEKAIAKQLSQEIEQLYAQEVERQKSGIDRPIESVVEEEMRAAKTIQQLEKEKATLKQLSQEIEQLHAREVERQKSGIDRPIESVVEEEMGAAKTKQQLEGESVVEKQKTERFIHTFGQETPKVPLNVLPSPEQSFEREVGKNEVLFKERWIGDYQLVSLQTPTGTPGAEKFILVESPTGKKYLFNAEKLDSKTTPNQLQEFVIARETRITPQQKPLTPEEIFKVKREANKILETLKKIPKNFQTPDIKQAINNLEIEIKSLSMPLPPTKLPALEQAKVLIADIAPQLPSLLSPFSTQQVQQFREIAKAATAVVPKSELPSGLTPYQGSSILVSKDRSIYGTAAIPVGNEYVLIRGVDQAFLGRYPVSVLESFAKNINSNPKAWQQFSKTLYIGGIPTTAELEALLPITRPATSTEKIVGSIQKEYDTARTSMIKGIDSLNKIISQRTSEITRVGAALFLALFQNPNYRPFENIRIPDLPAVDIPGIKDIELNNAELGIFLAPPQVFSIWAQGNARVINIPLFAKVMFNFEKMQNPTTKTMVDNTGIILQAGLPEAWKFSDSFPNMKDWDRFQIKRAYVYVSSINYIDYSIPTQLMPSASIAIANVPGRPTVGMLPGIMIRPGLSLYGEINLRKLIPELFDHLNFAGLETASLYGTISHKPENCQLGIGLPDLVKIENSPFKLGGVWAEIHMKNMAVPGAPVPLFKPEASIVIALVIQPSPKDETLTFTARASSDEAGGMVAFTMQGFWNNAFGVEGLSIGDLALQLHTDYKALLAGIPVSGGGFTGTVKFGTQAESPIIKMAALYAMASTGQEMALQGKLDGTLSIWQIIDGCKSLAIKKAQLDKKPIKTIEDDYNKILNNTVAKQLGNVAIRNVEMKVAPSTVRIGEFFILQGFTAKGEMTLLGVTAGMDFNLGQSGLTATGYLSPIKIGDVFSLTGAGMDKQYGTPDDAALMSLALNFVKQHFIITGQVKLLGIEQQTDIFIDTEGLNCTISGKLFNLFDASVQLKSRGDITNPDLYFKASMKQEFTKYLIDETIKALRASTQDSVAKINDAQNEVNKLNNNVADLERQISERKRRIDELGKNFLEGLKNSPEITKLGIEIAGLETGKAGAVAARETAKGVLEGVKRWVGGASIIAEALIHVAVPLDIRESAIEASVQDIAKGKLPRFTAVASIAGKKLNLDMQLDFSSPEKAQQSANAIAQQILGLFK